MISIFTERNHFVDFLQKEFFRCNDMRFLLLFSLGHLTSSVQLLVQSRKLFTIIGAQAICIHNNLKTTSRLLQNYIKNDSRLLRMVLKRALQRLLADCVKANIRLFQEKLDTKSQYVETKTNSRLLLDYLSTYLPAKLPPYLACCQARLSSLRTKLKLSFSSISSFSPPQPGKFSGLK